MFILQFFGMFLFNKTHFLPYWGSAFSSDFHHFQRQIRVPPQRKHKLGSQRPPMTNVADGPPNGSTSTTVEEKHLKRPDSLKRHAEAQERYRGKNLEATQAKARERMQRLRANRTSDQVLQASENRRGSDADYNEHQRRLRFVAKYGHLHYLDYYCPQYKLQGKRHLAGLRFDDLEKDMRQNEGKKNIIDRL
ncbi:hypothetical protein K438DRAFT_1767893 [Mycena galopus ATCC 62051]|nr:hypothetical protein K438DRAFT_1767893 [Mycena galopus ATCC 62051]